MDCTRSIVSSVDLCRVFRLRILHDAEQVASATPAKAKPKGPVFNYQAKSAQQANYRQVKFFCILCNSDKKNKIFQTFHSKKMIHIHHSKWPTS